MTDQAALSRMQEAERVLLQAIEDVPLTCDAREASAAIQSIGLRMAERVMPPAAIARCLMAQAEGYLRKHPADEGAFAAQANPAKAHAILNQAVSAMIGAGLDKGEAGEAMLTFVAAWLSSADPRQGAETFYRLADAMAARTPTQH